MKQYDYTLVGGAAMVQMLRFQKLPEVGETSMPINRNPAELYFGGCGFNIYSGLAKLGVPVMPVLTHAHPMLAERLETEIKYAGYIARQDRMIHEVARHEKTLIPEDFSYTELTGLTLEAREKLARIRPKNLGQAGRIPGVSPSDVAQLSIALAAKRS